MTDNKQTSVEIDEQGLEKAWRQLRNRLNDGVPKTNEELKEMTSKVITSYIIHRSF